MTEHQAERDEKQEEPVVVRDRRKIDPETGELRQERNGAVDAQESQQAAEAKEAEAAEGGKADQDAEVAAAVQELQKQLDERTADLQRVQAEYNNYRRRVDREREEMAEGGKAAVLNELLPLLDDLERAEAHGDLTGAFKAVADKLVGTLERIGLEPFGKEGDAFDPSVHEAVQHSTSPDVDGPTVTTVLRRGYRFGERVLREALVGVTDHEPAAASDEKNAESAESGAATSDTASEEGDTGAARESAASSENASVDTDENKH
ncbi:nucleotide exchange factor GrpE [Saccharomonospora viridis]|uniref:Protein GrpE n=1 Tax=Saccharomonospora viridis TaxID=1852 RepID=A0A837DBL7_9PSEU|nr:nucleotide exchange factor GrpE [Saccharomonospora viridis]KHF44595.1 molecular chaperone GrpE [Saccharomonospora viridis]SFP25052.1 molecular chaperone GrpE [Saccharomonospora viridis]